MDKTILELNMRISAEELAKQLTDEEIDQIRDSHQWTPKAQPIEKLLMPYDETLPEGIMYGFRSQIIDKLNEVITRLNAVLMREK